MVTWIKRYVFPVLGALFLSSAAFANNVTVSNVTLTRQDATNDPFVKFDISWDNSWRTSSNAPNNWDAVWVFVKYKVGSGAWKHATLSDTAGNHTAPSGSTVTPSSDGKGAFIYRSTDGSGTFSLSGVQLRWNYGTDGVADNASVTLKVVAVEMVYVPQGSFYLGSGGSGTSEFYKYPTTTDTYLVSSENEIAVGTTSGNLYYALSTNGGDQSVPILGAFPKGYNAFYCMKYEITQEQYVDFLNMLTYTQQTTRTFVSPNSTAGTKAMTTETTYRNGIEAQTPGSTGKSAVYACDLTDDGTYNASDDGQNVACNFLSWADGTAYADWAALRPMTELEYEKACRGTLSAVANEYAWGTTSITQATGITNGGAGNETASNSGANCVCDNASLVAGPMRAGSFATASSGRADAGATYYGIMEMSGNLWERCVTIGNRDGRSFTGSQGDGVLDSTGNANTSSWPGTGALGTGFRGGDWRNDATHSRVSDRGDASDTGSNRYNNCGFRGVRLAP